MATDPYAEEMMGENVGSCDDVQNDRSEEEKERQFRRRKPLSKNPQIGIDVITLTEKIVLPVEEFPKYNFVGKLLGPKGSTLKNLQTDCKVRISIMGRGSSKERNKEEELIQTGDPQYDHLKEPLHVVVSARANKIEAHRRLAAACRELNKFMGPINEELYNPQQKDRNSDLISNGRDGMVPVGAAPKIMFGVPPPGAIILNDNPAAFAQARMSREERSPPPREAYAYRGYQDERVGNSRYTEKRSAVQDRDSGSYPLKRYKQDTYIKSEYSSR